MHLGALVFCSSASFNDFILCVLEPSQCVLACVCSQKRKDCKLISYDRCSTMINNFYVIFTSWHQVVMNNAKQIK